MRNVGEVSDILKPYDARGSTMLRTMMRRAPHQSNSQGLHSASCFAEDQCRNKARRQVEDQAIGCTEMLAADLRPPRRAALWSRGGRPNRCRLKSDLWRTYKMPIRDGRAQHCYLTCIFQLCNVQDHPTLLSSVSRHLEHGQQKSRTLRRIRLKATSTPQQGEAGREGRTAGASPLTHDRIHSCKLTKYLLTSLITVHFCTLLKI